MKNSILWVVGVVIVVAAGYFIVTKSSSTPSTSTNSSAQNTQGTQGNISTKSRVAVSFTDATTDIENVSEVSMNVKKVELYSQTHGWVTVSDNSTQYQLLKLHADNQTKIYAVVDVPVDTYTRSRVILGDVVVHTKSGAQKTATIPSNTLDIQSVINVQANKTSSLTLDVLADKSIHLTAKGDYVFAPVINVESRSNTTVNTTVDGIVTISGGSIDTSSSVGMDIDGSLKSNFRLDVNTKLDVDVNGTVKSTVKGVIDIK